VEAIARWLALLAAQMYARCATVSMVHGASCGVVLAALPAYLIPLREGSERLIPTSRQTYRPPGPSAPGSRRGRGHSSPGLSSDVSPVRGRGDHTNGGDPASYVCLAPLCRSLRLRRLRWRRSRDQSRRFVIEALSVDWTFARARLGGAHAHGSFTGKSCHLSSHRSRGPFLQSSPHRGACRYCS